MHKKNLPSFLLKKETAATLPHQGEKVSNKSIPDQQPGSSFYLNPVACRHCLKSAIPKSVQLTFFIINDHDSDDNTILFKKRLLLK